MSLNYFLGPAAPVGLLLVFLAPSAGTQLQGDPFSGGAKYMVVGKFCDFRRKSLLISETVRDKPMVAFFVCISIMNF